jgi:hypothetical protein
VPADVLAFFSVTLGLVNFLLIECVAVEDAFTDKKKAGKHQLHEINTPLFTEKKKDRPEETNQPLFTH